MENQQQITRLVQEIISMGLTWVPAPKKARTMVNRFYDPKSDKYYSTYTKGAVRVESTHKFGPYGGINMTRLNIIERTKQIDRFGRPYTDNKIIMLDTETERLTRLRDAIKNAHKRQK